MFNTINILTDEAISSLLQVYSSEIVSIVMDTNGMVIKLSGSNPSIALLDDIKSTEMYGLLYTLSYDSKAIVTLRSL